MRPTRDVSDAIGFAELFPEYLSLLLFRRKILTDEMMIRHLNQIPVMLPRTDCPFPEEGGTVRPAKRGTENAFRFGVEDEAILTQYLYLKAPAHSEHGPFAIPGRHNRSPGAWGIIHFIGLLGAGLDPPKVSSFTGLSCHQKGYDLVPHRHASNDS
jgi:hypothetical protein